jgi:peroxiredoxin
MVTTGRRIANLVLEDHTGWRRSLSDLAGGDPVLLHFYRGWWCPKERAWFRRLLELQDEAEVAYTRFVSVSVDPPETAAAFRAGLEARWTFLCDPERRYLGPLGLEEVADDVHRPYLPVVATLFPDLTVHGLHVGYWYWGRPTLDELRTELREITREIRADWEPEGR